MTDTQLTIQKNNLGAVTLRVQGSGRIQVEVPAEKGDEVRGHRSPSSLEKPDTLTLIHRDVCESCRFLSGGQKAFQNKKKRKTNFLRTLVITQFSQFFCCCLTVPTVTESPLDPPTTHACCQQSSQHGATPTPMTQHARTTRHNWWGALQHDAFQGFYRHWWEMNSLCGTVLDTATHLLSPCPSTSVLLGSYKKHLLVS